MVERSSNIKDSSLVVPKEETTTVEEDLLSPFSRIRNDLENFIGDDDGIEIIDKSITIIHSKASRATSEFTQPVNKKNTESLPIKTQPAIVDHQGLDVRASRSLWVGNIDPNATEAELRKVFEPFGEIEGMRLLPIKECAFVNFVRIQDAVNAKDSLQGSSVGNMIIRIGFGKDNYNNEPRGNNNFGDPSTTQQLNNSRSVWVGNINSLEVNSEILREAFESFGKIESCRVLEDKNCAFVNFYSVGDAEIARKRMNGAVIGSSIVRTGLAKSTTTKADELEVKFKPLNEIDIDSQDVTISTQDVSIDEFNKPLPVIPNSVSLPQELDSSILRECRRRVEHPAATVAEIDEFSEQIMGHILAASIDPIGNILVQKLIERGSEETKTQILEKINIYLASVGIHKNGTWVVQKLTNNCKNPHQQSLIANLLRPHLVPLLKDQFGNYVVQCCLTYGPNGNQFIFDALYHRCLEIATSRFGSRAMKSCLESPHVSTKQKKFVAMAILSHALSLVQDVNGVIIVQWFLDSDLPGRFEFLAPVLKGHYANLCLCKHASTVIAKLIQPASDPLVRQLIVEELFSSSLIPNLLKDQMSAAILFRGFLSSNGNEKIRYAHIIKSHLLELGNQDLKHLKNMSLEVDSVLSFVVLETERNSMNLDRGRGSSTLLTHAVGGPVTNASIIKTCKPNSQSSLKQAANISKSKSESSNPLQSHLFSNSLTSRSQSQFDFGRSFGPELLDGLRFDDGSRSTSPS